MNNPYDWLQDLMERVPDLLQPLIVALAAAIPYVEGEGAVALGIIAGIHPVVAALAAITGNILCVVGVVLLGSRLRGGVLRRRARAGRPEEASVASSADGSGAATLGAPATTDGPDAGASGTGTGASGAGAGTTAAVAVDPGTGGDDGGETAGAKPTRRSRGRARLRRWMVKFGVPGASLLAPLALPTMLTAAFFVASGVRKEWVILWQVVAIVLWTGAVAAAATGILAVLGW
ncbi:hypothetical protein [Auraticoccus monumenti]|uniref:Small multidrug efflux protein n=1 Tax=Auraticoccus monumenti TaxID=675864 RepID=A0A1G6STU3_9ACTN|nr:hypothetical protein [Auraticoccus monumenti]SDD20111.1 hypothetical protein SAMN04489747_0422 [Auraticoccus monumenti]